MELVHGRTYKDRLGESVKVMLVRPGHNYPFNGNNGCSYMADGKYIPEENLPVNDFDLIEEVYS